MQQHLIVNQTIVEHMETKKGTVRAGLYLKYTSLRVNSIDFFP